VLLINFEGPFSFFSFSPFYSTALLRGGSTCSKMYSIDGNDSIRSGTVPLPPSSPSSRRLQSTSSRSLSSTHGRRISLPSTTQDPMLFDNSPINQGKKNSDDAAFDSKGVSSSFLTRNPEPVEEAQRPQSIGGSTRRTRTRSEQSSWLKGVREPNSAVRQELSGRDWAPDSTLNGRDPGEHTPSASCNICTSRAELEFLSPTQILNTVIRQFLTQFRPHHLDQATRLVHRIRSSILPTRETVLRQLPSLLLNFTSRYPPPPRILSTLFQRRSRSDLEAAPSRSRGCGLPATVLQPVLLRAISQLLLLYLLQVRSVNHQS